MSNRFHNKFHRQNHHSANTSGYPDSAYDPIASYAAPFQGEFYSQGDILTTENLSAVKDVFATNGTLYNNLSVGYNALVQNDLTVENNALIEQDLTVENNVQVNNNLNVTGNTIIENNLTVLGNLSTLGTVSQLDTLVYVTSALSVTNSGTGPAATIVQTGVEDVAVFRDDSNTTLIIKDGGNVGINTATPSEKLDVNGNAIVRGNTTITDGLSVDTNTFTVEPINNRVGINTNDPNQSLTVIGNVSASGDATIDGSVGIGETSPEAKLHVKNSSAGTVTAHPSSVGVFESEGHAYISLLAPDNHSSGIVMGGPGDNYAAYINWNHDNGDLKIATSHPGADMHFLVGNEVDAVRIASNGNVGVGTITPNEKLTVVGNISAVGTHVFAVSSLSSCVRITQTGDGEALRVEDPTNPDSTPFIVGNDGRVYLGSTQTLFNANLIIERPFQQTSQAASVYSNSPANSANNLLANGIQSVLVADAGNYSISSLNAFFAEGVDIRTSGVTATNVCGFLAHKSLSGVGLTNYGFYSDLIFSNDPNVTNYNFYSNGGASNYFEGNVGIGTTSPNEKLTIAGNLSASGDVSTRGRFLSAGVDIITLFGGGGGGGGLAGSGTTNYISKWNGTTSLTNSSIFDDGTNVGIGTTSPNEKLTVVGNISASGDIAAQSSTIPVSVTSITTNRTFSDSDTNKVFHLSGSSPLSAIFPSSLSDGFNVALMNTGTSTLHLSTNSPYKAIGNVLTYQYAGAYVYKANSEIFAVGGF